MVWQKTGRRLFRMDQYLWGSDAKWLGKASSAAAASLSPQQHWHKLTGEAKAATDIIKITAHKQYQFSWWSSLPEEKDKQPRSKIGGQQPGKGEGSRRDSASPEQHLAGQPERPGSAAGQAPSVLSNKQTCLLGESTSATCNCSCMDNCLNSIKFLFLMNSGEESPVMKPTLSWNNCEHSWSKQFSRQGMLWASWKILPSKYQ